MKWMLRWLFIFWLSEAMVIPLAVVGIVMKVFGIVVSIVIGISLGGQPIIGFNMGAGNSERVKETISTITKIVLAIGTVFFLIFELAPDFVISLFGKNNSPEYTEYARLCVRICIWSGYSTGLRRCDFES